MNEAAAKADLVRSTHMADVFRELINGGIRYSGSRRRTTTHSRCTGDVHYNGLRIIPRVIEVLDPQVAEREKFRDTLHVAGMKNRAAE